MKFNRIILIVLDSVGVGEMPDAAEYGDVGANTLGNVSRAVGGLSLPVLGEMGLGNLTEVQGVKAKPSPKAHYGKCALAAPNKDTTSGHWEMMGAVLKKKLPVYPNGFPDDLVAEFCRQAGVDGVLGNKAASGTTIINELGDEHCRTGYPIVYTSADSVCQIACHEETFGLERLYEICGIARELLNGAHEVGRVIARPFVGSQGEYSRTKNRLDLSMLPPVPTVLDYLTEKGIPVVGVGKIKDIFANKGVPVCEKTANNVDGIQKTIKAMDDLEHGMIFANLVDFDMLFGHRNNPTGYAASLEEFDEALPLIKEKLKADDLLILCSDHGNDPTTPGTDHAREYCLLIAFHKGIKQGRDLGTRSSLADIGATIALNFGVDCVEGEPLDV